MTLGLPINLLNSFCSTGLQRATHLPSKLSYSKSHERFQTEALNYTTAEDEPIQTSTKWGMCLQFRSQKVHSHHILLKQEHFQAVPLSGKMKWRNWYPEAARPSLQHVHQIRRGVLQCAAFKNVITFPTAGRNGRSEFYKVLFSVSTRLGFWQVSLPKELVSVQCCKSWETVVFTYGIMET